MAMHKAGSIHLEAFKRRDEVRIDFSGCVEDAVIMLFPDTESGETLTPVVTHVDDRGFTVRLEDWQKEIGPTPAAINWIAMEPGTHVLPDGHVIEAFAPQPGAKADQAPATAAHQGPGPTENPVISKEEAAERARLEEEELILDAAFYQAIRQAAGKGSAGAAAEATADPEGHYGGYHDEETDRHVHHGPAADSGDTYIEDWLCDYVIDHEGAGAAGLPFDADVLHGIGGAPCYTPGTLITTLRGQIDAAQLEAGALVLTRDHGFQTLRKVVRTVLPAATIAADPELAPILVKAGALGPGRPAVDMRVSPNHRVLLTGLHAELLAGQDEVFVAAKSLVDGTHVIRTPVAEVTYLLLLFDHPQVIYADGAASESLATEMVAGGGPGPGVCPDLPDFFPSLASKPPGMSHAH